MTRDGHIHFEEFVSIVRSKAATGVLFHDEKVNWCLNSFFGVGDTIGFQVGCAKGSTLPRDDVVMFQTETEVQSHLGVCSIVDPDAVLAGRFHQWCGQHF